MKQKKDTYLSPRIEVIKVENEGVIALSSGTTATKDFGNDGVWTGLSTTRSAGSNDIEDMINDILTVE